MSIPYTSLVDTLAYDIAEHLILDEDDEETMSAVRSLAYNLLQDREKAIRLTAQLARDHFSALLPSIPKKEIPGMVHAIAILDATTREEVSVVPEDISTEDFLPDPLEDRGVGDDVELEYVGLEESCGEAVELSNGDYITCNRPPHTSGWWHVSLEEEEDVVYARWRGTELEIEDDD